MLRGRRTPADPHAFFGEDRRGVETEAGETVEIDARRDLYWAEAVLRDRAASVEGGAEAGVRGGAGVNGTAASVRPGDFFRMAS
jgi:hypothetical protein